MILALAGGVGGAKLANGLARILDAEGLVIAVNTGDDFRHLGLHISPDIDTVMYNLARLNNPETGWGLVDDTWNVMSALRRIGGPDWFNLGDKDLATHLERTRRLSAGESLSAITAALCKQLGISHRITPMCDEMVMTLVRSNDKWIAFQEYFVALKCEPKVSEFRFYGVELAEPSLEFRSALESKSLRGIVFCPSNPFVSIDPILAIPGVRSLLAERKIPVIAVSPIVGGQALKGPASKMMVELGLDPSPLGVARHYGSMLSGMIIDSVDLILASKIDALGIRTEVTNTVMKNANDQEALARVALDFIESIREGK